MRHDQEINNYWLEDWRSFEIKIKPCNCAIRSKSNFLKGINYIIYEYNDPGHARTGFKKMQNSHGTISEVDGVPDIGYENFWVGDNRFQRMVSIKGDVVVDVLSPKEFDLQKQIISLVIVNH